MKPLIAAALLTTLAPTLPAAPAAPAAPDPPATQAIPAAHVTDAGSPARIRVTARIVVVDREAATRAGLGYVVLGTDRVRVGREARELRPSAFLDLVRQRRLIRSESTQQVLVVSGGEARVASQDLAMGRHSARTRGPTLLVSPAVGDDGLVHLRVRAAHEDVATYGSTYGGGYVVDGSPAAVDTEVLARSGEELIVASGSMSETTSESGLLRWGSGTHERDILIVLRADVLE